MKRQFLMLEGVTKRARHEVTLDVRDAISSAGGWIIDQNFFSNIALAIRFVLPSRGLDELQRCVTVAAVSLDDRSLAMLRQTIEVSPTAETEITASLSITFSHNEPDLRQEIPAVPG